MFINRTISRACRPGHRPRMAARGVAGAEFIIRRLDVILALGALLGMVAGMLAASPALAGRGPKWQLPQATPGTMPAGAAALVQAVSARGSESYRPCLTTGQ